MGPGLDGEIGLGIETDAEDDDGEEAGDVARELPVLPFTGLAGRERGSVEEVAFGVFFVAGAGPAAGAGGGAAAGAEGLDEALAEHLLGAPRGYDFLCSQRKRE